MSPIVDAVARDVSANTTAATATTTWLPLLIAILGFLSTLLGVIFTQLWNSHLEKRRWENEQHQQSMADAREDANRIYEHRREAYVSFLRDLERLRRAYTDVSYPPPKPSHGTFDALWDLWTAVMVYGTSEAQELAQDCSDSFGMLHAEWAENEDRDSTIIDSLMDSWHQLLDQVRKDLSVPDLTPGRGA